MTEMGMVRASENEGESPEYQESILRFLSASKSKKESQTLPGNSEKPAGSAVRCGSLHPDWRGELVTVRRLFLPSQHGFQLAGFPGIGGGFLLI